MGLAKDAALSLLAEPVGGAADFDSRVPRLEIASAEGDDTGAEPVVTVVFRSSKHPGRDFTTTFRGDPWGEDPPVGSGAELAVHIRLSLLEDVETDQLQP